MIFRDRYDAGRALARHLEPEYAGKDVVVLALPRGGVPVAYEVAQALHAPLDVFVVRKLGVPRHEELAMGALASGGTRVLNEGVIEALGIPRAVVDAITRREAEEVTRRERMYRGDRPPIDVSGKIGVIVDDGLATGATMRAAVLALRQRAPSRIVVAVPVAALSTCEDLAQLADQAVCAETPEQFYAVGSWYENFAQTTDEEVRMLLDRAARRPQLVA